MIFVKTRFLIKNLIYGIITKNRILFSSFFFKFFSQKSIFSHFIELIEVVAGTRFRIWVAEKKAREQFSRLRYSGQESGTDKYTNNLREYSKKHHVPAEIGLYLSRSPFTRPQKKVSMNFPTTKKTNPSTELWEIVCQNLSVWGGGARMGRYPVSSTSLGDSYIMMDALYQGYST